MDYADRVFGKTLEDIDARVSEIIDLEETRQNEKIILIPSESICPSPVLRALGSPLNNIYAEGYPPSMMDGEGEEILSDLDFQLSRFRRYSDRRFYKGCEFANLMEALAGRRAASLFCTEKTPPENIYVNVQPLSGSVANSAIYDAFLSSGDVLMGLSLMHGGHLSHGSEFNRSGKEYHIVSYEVDPSTGMLNYEQIESLVLQHRPKMIVAGYTSYPWAPDWKLFREIADRVGALLLADISHPAGLVVAGVYPNPIDFAHVTMCTTHKTLFGPRGAIIMTTDKEYSEKINAAIFPGEQGGPHVNKFAAMAVAFRIAQTAEFREVQKNIVKNAASLAGALRKRGLALANGGTNTHLLLIDLRSVHTESGFQLKGEIAVRILDIAGIVANKNTIPGDMETAEASGVRLGTPWITQRGITEEGIEELADVISMLLLNIHPFAYEGLTGSLPRGKIDFDLLLEATERVRRILQNLKGEHPPAHTSIRTEPGKVPPGLGALLVSGKRSVYFFEGICTQKIAPMETGDTLSTFFFDREGKLIAPVLLHRMDEDPIQGTRFLILCARNKKERVKSWLNGLSDGYLAFDDEDIFKKIDGPVVIHDLDEYQGELDGSTLSRLEGTAKAIRLPVLKGGGEVGTIHTRFPEQFDLSKPYFIGQRYLPGIRQQINDKIDFIHTEKDQKPLKSCLYEEHLKLSAQMVSFAGWKMPVRYESILEEHRAVREKAALFDISHMGMIEVSGREATQFLDTLCTNYVPWIRDGESQYSYLLDPDGVVIDDVMVYRLSKERYILVVNAVNTCHDLAWMKAVNLKRVLIDRQRPGTEILSEVRIRDLKNTDETAEAALVNIAIQGPESLPILLEVAGREKDRLALKRLQKTKLLSTSLFSMDVMAARTGYTGEEYGYELFVHPDRAGELWRQLLDVGKPHGLRAAGLGARDSLRIEAGLPLYGHELAGRFGISPVEAGFGYYVKFHKLFFIGRKPLLERTLSSRMAVIRFRMSAKGVRMVKSGDRVASSRTQQIIGHITSCAVDAEGFQVGMAYVDRRFTPEGTRVALIPEAGPAGASNKRMEELGIGDRFPLQVDAVVLNRFPMKDPLNKQRGN
jgi:glycine hydroxymethyltransferase